MGKISRPLQVKRKRNRQEKFRFEVAPERGLEPLTRRLTAGCSTIELLWKQNGSEKLQIDLRTVNEFPATNRRRAHPANLVVLIREARGGRDLLVTSGHHHDSHRA